MSNEHDDHAAESFAMGEDFGRELITAMDDAQWTQAQKNLVLEAIERAYALLPEPKDER